MPTDDSDTALVQAARGGDRAALAALLARHWPLLLALCRRALGDPLLAEDAAQEAALQALLNLDRLRRADRFGAWLGGIGLNVCRRWRRQRARGEWSWEEVYGGVRAPEPLDRAPDPADLAEAADLAAQVRRAVATLPPGQRAAVRLFYLQGLTQAETAALLGIDAGAVKTRLHKARATLRRQLQEVWKEATMATEAATGLVEMRVADVRRRPAEAGDIKWQSVVVLEEVGGTRRLPIWIGPFEAEALVMHLEGIAVPRPMTYAFAASLLRALGGRLGEVRITRLVETVFYAEAIVEGPTGTTAIDARPSDALNLALLSGAPIRASAAVLDTAEWREKGEGAGSEGRAEIAAAIRAAQRKTPCAAESEPGTATSGV